MLTLKISITAGGRLARPLQHRHTWARAFLCGHLRAEGGRLYQLVCHSLTFPMTAAKSTRLLAKEQVDRFPGNGYAKYATWSLAVKAWQDTCKPG